MKKFIRKISSFSSGKKKKEGNTEAEGSSNTFNTERSVAVAQDSNSVEKTNTNAVDRTSSKGSNSKSNTQRKTSIAPNSSAESLAQVEVEAGLGFHSPVNTQGFRTPGAGDSYSASPLSKKIAGSDFDLVAQDNTLSRAGKNIVGVSSSKDVSPKADKSRKSQKGERKSSSSETKKIDSLAKVAVSATNKNNSSSSSSSAKKSSGPASKKRSSKSEVTPKIQKSSGSPGDKATASSPSDKATKKRDDSLEEMNSNQFHSNMGGPGGPYQGGPPGVGPPGVGNQQNMAGNPNMNRGGAGPMGGPQNGQYGAQGNMGPGNVSQAHANMIQTGNNNIAAINQMMQQTMPPGGNNSANTPMPQAPPQGGNVPYGNSAGPGPSDAGNRSMLAQTAQNNLASNGAGNNNPPNGGTIQYGVAGTLANQMNMLTMNDQNGQYNSNQTITYGIPGNNPSVNQQQMQQQQQMQPGMNPNSNLDNSNPNVPQQGNAGQNNPLDNSSLYGTPEKISWGASLNWGGMSSATASPTKSYSPVKNVGVPQHNGGQPASSPGASGSNAMMGVTGQQQPPMMGNNNAPGAGPPGLVGSGQQGGAPQNGVNNPNSFFFSPHGRYVNSGNGQYGFQPDQNGQQNAMGNQPPTPEVQMGLSSNYNQPRTGTAYGQDISSLKRK